ncbi:hypothetical protein [Paenibacillus alba]|nr:hypothetical protein [Paenibacillus alba]
MSIHQRQQSNITNYELNDKLYDVILFITLVSTTPPYRRRKYA